MSRKKLIAANWKMYKNPAQTKEFFRDFLPLVTKHDRDEIVVCPPYVDLQAATYAGLLFIGPSTAIQGATLDGVTIESAGSYGLQVAPTASGSASASGVVVTGAATGGLSNGAPGAFTLTRQAGDSGW